MKHNLLLIIPTLSSGGAERVMSELANSLVQSGHHITIVLWIGGSRFYQLDKNVKVIDFDSSHGSKLNKLLNLVQVIYKLRKVYLQEKPDAVISFLTKSNIIALWANLFLGNKIYISERNNPETWDDHPKIILFLRNIFYRQTAGFIAQTEVAKEASYGRFGIIKSTVIPNPIKELLKEGIEKKEKIILNIGRLDKQKGQAYLLKAFAKLKYKNWKLVILGEGPLRKELEGIVKKLKIDDRVYMPGNVKNIDVWLNKSSVFVLSSLYEGFPNALLEAMGAGLPCISFDCPTGPGDIIIDKENGFLVPLKDTDMLTIKLEQLIYDKDLRKQFSIEAIKVNKEYSINKITTKLLNFIDIRNSNEEK